MLKTINLGLQYGSRKLFEHVDLQFTKGNCYGVIGANGAGKSTLIEKLKARFANLGVPILFTREPSESEIGSENRSDPYSGPGRSHNKNQKIDQLQRRIQCAEAKQENI